MKRKRFHVHFANQEHRKLEHQTAALVATATLYAADPDVIAELLAIAEDLQRPAAPLDHHARTVWIIQAGRRIGRLATRIVAKEPPTHVPMHEPQRRRLAGSRPLVERPRPPRRIAGQMELRV